jgi:multidrug efflux system membrane fusion protein
VHLILEERANAVVVPAAAVQHSTEGDYVWVVRATVNPEAEPGDHGPDQIERVKPGSGTVVMRPVVIDTTQASIAIVSRGLSGGEQVVVDGADKLQNDARVSTTMLRRPSKKEPQQQLGSS